MKKVLKIISLILAVSSPTNLVAQDIGIKFAKMPVGIKAHYKNSKNEKWTLVYRGQFKGKYLLENRNALGALNYTGYYNAKGHLLYRAYPSGNIRSFRPTHCGRVLGACNYTFHNSNGNSGKGRAKLQTSSGGYTYSYKITNSDNWKKSRFTLANYNLPGSGTRNGYNYKLIKLTR